MNRLFFGDNLDVLRSGQIKDESVDLIYLDPPFNSNTTYNVLFKTPKGQQSIAQITAFEDSWHWGPQAEQEFAELIHGPNTDTAELIQALRKVLGESDMMAYLTMMASRLVELHRALKPTGSLYLHCDPTASHYLKIMLDGIFGAQNFRNEITWKRTHAHGNVGRNYGSIADNLFFYSKTDKYTWNQPFTTLSEDEIVAKYPMVDPDGRRWQSVTLRNPGLRPNLHFPYKASNGITYQPHRNGWSCNLQRLQKYDREGRLHFPMKKDGALRLKMFADESLGERVQNIWTDIPPIGALAAERLGYPTQKPLALLERIIQASSREGDVLLDPFCGCGTAVHAAQKLNREWVGIDITHLAIAIIEKRLRDAFPDITFQVHGTPTDAEGATELANRDKYEFQYWACSLINAQPYRQKKKGADTGIDGLIYFQDDLGPPKKIVVSVKGGQNVSAQMLRDLRGVVEREKAAMGMFVTLSPPTKPMRDEAVKAGFYVSPIGPSFPKIQTLTVERLMAGTDQPQYPDLKRGGHTFKRLPVERPKVEQGELFGAGADAAPKNVQPLIEAMMQSVPVPSIAQTRAAKPRSSARSLKQRAR
jgi:site-specific DNA-methyltransferase (adenine-specific)